MDKYKDITNNDLYEMMFKIWKNKFSIFVICMIMATLTFIYTNFTYTPVFSSSTEIYILDNRTESIDYTSMQIASQLTNDYVELIRSISVMEQAVESLDLKDATPSYLQSKITVSAKKDTRVISITAKASDPYKAYEYAKAVRIAASEKLNSVLSTDSVRLVSEASVPTYAAGSGAKKMGLLIFILTFVVCSGVIILTTLLDDKFKSAEEVEKYTGLTVLGVIPMEEVKNKKDKKKKRKRGGKK